jgi:hypothetical protein
MVVAVDQLRFARAARTAFDQPVGRITTRAPRPRPPRADLTTSG